jgi:hypothetical protein
MFVQRLSLVQVLRSILHNVGVWGLRAFVPCSSFHIVRELGSTCTRLALAKKNMRRGGTRDCLSE